LFAKIDFQISSPLKHSYEYMSTMKHFGAQCKLELLLLRFFPCGSLAQAVPINILKCSFVFYG